MKKRTDAPTDRLFEKIGKIGMVLPVAAASLLSTGSVAQVAGSPAKMTLGSAMPDPNGEITADRQRAYRLFKAITGIAIAIDDSRLAQMESLIAAGNEKGAAAIATSDPSFYDVQLRDLARKMSVREESVTAPLSDFVATFVGVARDGLDARELLSGNFIYRADIAKVLVNGQGQPEVRNDTLADIVNSNNHYADLQARSYSLYSVLVRENGQQYSNDGETLQPMTDAAGLITTRQWIREHADAGTNRRLVEFSFRQFMCAPMEAWMDASRPDDFVGRDVDRFPGGSHEKYQVTCKACHTQMDAFRQAFAYVNFAGGRTRLTPGQVVGKMNRNSNMFPSGYSTTNDRWVNYATAPRNADQFGWRGPASGSGMADFGRLLANSKGFSRCMTKRVFASICKRAPGPAEEAAIRVIADQFEGDYKLKGLAETVAVSPICISRE